MIAGGTALRDPAAPPPGLPPLDGERAVAVATMIHFLTATLRHEPANAAATVRWLIDSGVAEIVEVAHGSPETVVPVPRFALRMFGISDAPSRKGDAADLLHRWIEAASDRLARAARP